MWLLAVYFGFGVIAYSEIPGNSISGKLLPVPMLGVTISAVLS